MTIKCKFRNLVKNVKVKAELLGKYKYIIFKYTYAGGPHVAAAIWPRAHSRLTP